MVSFKNLNTYAYMTIIIISVSWLMAIISIMFGSYTHIKMFFTLCLTMVLWTPILSIINFLNDLNIQHTFGVINQNDAAFTYSNYKEVIQKVTANSNFLNYLVMLTPMLAYALAKGSEMGFVSIASSLSQQLAGASRAASGFATQQALSTSTAITTPKGDEVYAREAGATSHKSAFYDGSGRLTAFNTKTDGNNGVENSELNNSIFNTTNVGGIANGTTFSGGTMTSAASMQQQASNAYNRAWTDEYGKLNKETVSSMYEVGRQLMESDNKEFKENFQRNLESALQSSSSISAETKAYVRAGAGIEVFGFGGKAGVEGSAGMSANWTDAEKDSFSQAINKATAQTLTQMDGESAKFAKGLSGEQSEAFKKLMSVSKTYQETTASVQAVTGNNADNVLNYHAQHLAHNDGKDWNNLNTAEQNQYFTQAGNDINGMLKNNHAALSQLNKLAGAAGIVKDGSFGVKAQGMNFKEINVNDCSAYMDFMKNTSTIGEKHSNKADDWKLTQVGQGSHPDPRALNKNLTNPNLGGNSNGSWF